MNTETEQLLREYLLEDKRKKQEHERFLEWQSEGASASLKVIFWFILLFIIGLMGFAIFSKLVELGVL